MIYETAEDLYREDAVAGIVASRWDCKHVKLGELSPIDRALFRDGALKCYVEIKTFNSF